MFGDAIADRIAVCDAKWKPIQHAHTIGVNESGYDF